MCHVGSQAIANVQVHPAFQYAAVSLSNLCEEHPQQQFTVAAKAQSAAEGCMWQGCCRYNEIRSEFDREAATLDMPPRDSITISRISLIAQVSLAVCE